MTKPKPTLNQADLELLEQRFAIKKDLQGFATKEDLKAFATKKDLEVFATKEDLKAFATKEDLKTTRSEIVNAVGELIDQKIDEGFQNFEEKHFNRYDEMITKLDKAIGKVDDFRNTQELHALKHQDIDDKFESVGSKLKVDLTY